MGSKQWTAIGSTLVAVLATYALHRVSAGTAHEIYLIAGLVATAATAVRNVFVPAPGSPSDASSTPGSGS